jgi:hypothetical protein
MEQLDRLGWAARRGFRIGTNRFEIRTTSARFAAWLDGALSAYRTDRAVPPRYSIVMEDDGDSRGASRPFHLLYRGAKQLVRSLSAQTVARMLLAELEAIPAARRRDAVYLRSSLLRADGRSALLPSAFLTWIGGLGGHVRRAGVTLPISNWVAVDRSTGEVVPRAPRLKVPPDALERLEDLFPGEAPPERGDPEAPLAVDVVFAVVSSDHPAVAPTTRAFALQQLAATLLNTGSMGEPVMRTLASLVGRARCFGIAYDHPRTMLGAIASVLREG